MEILKIKNLLMGAALTAGLAAVLSATANAATIDWTSWSSTFSTDPSSGSATGTAGSVGVSYSGELENLFFGYPSWGPNGTFNGGTISNAPPAAGGIIQLLGGNGAITDTITFSKPVTDPVLAIWSLGASGTTASFVFPLSEPFAVESGGPSNEYGGSAIVKDGNSVVGAEGNGTIQFLGTFSQISWTNPGYENWYGFTTGVAAVPEPATWAMMLVGFGGLGAAMRSSRRKQAAAA